MFELTPFRRIAAYDPFHELDSFLASQPKMTAAFSTDIIDNGDSYTLNAELPGFSKENIKLDIEDDRLNISAERKSEEEENKPNYIRRERFYGSFRRSFELNGIDTDKITAAYNDGILSVTLPKVVEVAPATRSIAID